jgi:hypothetical protein
MSVAIDDRFVILSQGGREVKVKKVPLVVHSSKRFRQAASELAGAIRIWPGEAMLCGCSS